MRHIRFSDFFVCSLILVSILLPVIAPSAQTSESNDVEPDTTTGHGHVRIRIDGDGISIEGDTRRGSGGWIEVTDERDDYDENGSEIVRFGESVFVGRNERVRGDITVFGGNAVIEGRVSGNVIVIGGNIRVRSGAEIKGDVVAIGGVIEEDDDVIIHGERVQVDAFIPFVGWDGDWFQPPLWVSTVGILLCVFVNLILFFIVVLFLRERVAIAHDHLTSSYLKSFGVGLLSVIIGCFGLGIVIVPLVITLIGIPLAILLLVSCCGVCIIGVSIFVLAVGRVVAGKMGSTSSNPFFFLLVGVLILILPEILATLLRLPGLSILAPLQLFFRLLGAFLATFALVSGIGSLVLSRFGSRPIVAKEAVSASVSDPVS